MTTTPAGWYPDPYGSPLLRWWDGTQWTEHTHPPVAGQSPPQPGRPQPAQQPWQPQPPAGPGPWPGQPAPIPAPGMGAPPRSSIWAWIAGGAALVVVLALILGGLLVFLNRDTSTAAQRPAPTGPLDSVVPQPSPSEDPLRPAQPSNGRIDDPVTGLSYLFPGAPWQPLTVRPQSQPGTPIWSSGYYAVSQENYDGRGNQWIGSIFAGILPESFSYDGPQDLKKVAESLLPRYESEFYPVEHKTKVVRSEAKKVGDREGWLIEFELDFSEASRTYGLAWKSERGAFVLVDRGAGQLPALMYLSIPENLDQSVLTRVLDSLEAR
ncbi:hypothetical protein TBS_34160 [Thermobispora bispora]|uniref:DUF2510 domain-containing protein n=1 Tax=Thermobispora bispora (strain ATCC 19993 / DSM 43833 / CBS 139.67 / JCM 10125 / KCTC 9307 / NBRC 14880 / R51) TaxID=469371 RepID=D6Y5I5_THEBD|nr:DUF2510 domain-containing protein [Thermobispora bispora]ADG89380.1 hypothetical protein Tbis_2679 [Thermobispora bispora DSM 43833]